MANNEKRGRQLGKDQLESASGGAYYHDTTENVNYYVGPDGTIDYSKPYNDEDQAKNASLNRSGDTVKLTLDQVKARQARHQNNQPQ